MFSKHIRYQSAPKADRISFPLLILFGMLILSFGCTRAEATRASMPQAHLQTLEQLRVELSKKKSIVSETNIRLAEVRASRKRLLSQSSKPISTEDLGERKNALRHQECFYKALIKRLDKLIGQLESKIQNECDSISIPRCDLALRYGRPLYPRTASTSGKVLYSGWLGGYGRSVIVRNSDEICTLFVQLRKPQVQEGQNIAKDQVIGYEAFERIGTGRSTCVVRVPNDMSERSEVLKRVSELAITSGDWK